MTQWSFYTRHASISSKTPKSFESTARHVCNTLDEPHSSPQKWGQGMSGSLLWQLTKQQTTCQQLHDHSVPVLNITEQKYSKFQTNFQNVSTLWYIFLSITSGSWTLFQVTFIMYSNSCMLESATRSICKTQCTTISGQMLHGKMFTETKLKRLLSGYTSSSTLPLT